MSPAPPQPKRELEFIHYYGPRGHHQLVCGKDHGAWVGFTAFATVTVRGKLYFIASNYYAGSMFHPETVYQLNTVVSADTEHVEVMR